MRYRIATIALARDDGFDFGLGKLLANEVGIVTLVCQ